MPAVLSYSLTVTQSPSFHRHFRGEDREVSRWPYPVIRLWSAHTWTPPYGVQWCHPRRGRHSHHPMLVLLPFANRTNYSIKAFTLLAQYCFLFSPRMAMQPMWNRIINIHGRPGRNVSCDLHLEHMNKEAKNSISGLGSNITDEAVWQSEWSQATIRSSLQRFTVAKLTHKDTFMSMHWGELNTWIHAVTI